MIANAIFITSIAFIAVGMYIMGELQFLAHYRAFIFHKYGAVIAWFCLAAFLNLFAVVYFATRKLYLKDTGKKLAHVEKQLRTGSSISQELTEHLTELD